MKGLALVLWSFSFIYLAQCRCSRRGAMESFILSTNALPGAFRRLLREVSLVECARHCLDDPDCRSLAFIRSGHNASECRLADHLPHRSRQVDDLSPLTLAPGTYHMEKVCLKGACDRLFVAESLRGMELEEHDDIVVANSSRLSCLESCLATKTIRCRSVEFDSKTAECRLSRHDRFTRKTHFRKSASASLEYFDVTCPYQPAESGPSPEIIQLGSVEHPYSLVEYEGVSAPECGELCLRNLLFPCRSFLSGRVGDRLYCGLTHQNREGLVQGVAASRSLNYYEIARNIDACDVSDLRFELVSGAVLDVTPYAVTSDLSPRECLERCRRDGRCRSLVVDYVKGSCQYNAESVGRSHEVKLQREGNFNYFEKVCLPGSECEADWTFERIRNKELVGQEKMVVEAHTREECQSACLHHREFACLSAEFNYQLNECRLSPFNRFSSADKGASLQDSRFVVDYFENNCAKEPRGFCNTKVVKRLRMLLTEAVIRSGSAEDCRRACFEHAGFVCRSLTFDPMQGLCGLSHHTRRSAPQESLVRAEGHELVEVSTCFDVSVECHQDRMLASVRTNALFRGKVYTKDRPLTCFADVSNKLEFALPISLSGADCGTISKEEGKFSNVLVIQSNDHVVTAMDKAIGIHCSFDVGNMTEDTHINITDPGSSDKSRGSPKLPDLSLHIVDMKGEERDTVSLGELLRVQVRMSDENTYGIFVRNLVAKDGSGANNLTLIDNSGCPVEVKMMREVRTIEPQSKSLEGYLEAFTFTGSSLLELEAEVETCLENCKPVLCQIPTGRRDDDTETVSSFGRRRRRDAEEVLASVTLSKSVAIQAEDFEGAKMLQPENYASPVTAPSAPDSRSNGDGLLQRLVPRGDTTFCFDPTLFGLIAGAFFLVEMCGFSACMVAACRWRAKPKKGSVSIHYGSDASAR